ncbi:FKBP-type peptidyl-prolyl cis-trans isomerase [Hymenobacter sp. BT730]|uniref:FKBP-type peptidyl-prolyl cis-trans isomerase n=1 Tax=Hymenobacter sp. BT730 TaxID=3063332 RepID=UPI0026DF4CBB|nr:FKBP-type peptidyl-prolyl cis-trans isomerase [Hymenobacter sp. BT730]
MVRSFSLKRSFLLRTLAVLLAFAAPVLSSCSSEPDYIKAAKQHEAEQKVKDLAAIQEWLTANNYAGSQVQTTESGISIVTLEAGNGPAVAKGKTLQVKYIGKLLNGVKFDSSIDNGSVCGCFSFLVGAGSVIPGWEEAVLLMKAAGSTQDQTGDHKLILIPSYLAYGASARGNIPADSPLVFDMQLLGQN